MTDLDKHSKDADVYAAMRTAALDFGIDELAAKMHTAIGTLYNKLNRNDSSAHHKPTVSDLIQIVFHTGNTAPIAALCRMFGGVFVRLPDLSKTTDDDLLQLINQWGAENGDVYEVMARALADLTVTQAEFNEMQQQTHEAISALLEVKARFGTLVVKTPRKR